jgi:hypothetical protein
VSRLHVPHYLISRSRRDVCAIHSTTPEQEAEALAGRLCEWIGMTPGITVTCLQMVVAAREHTDWQLACLNRELNQAEEAREEEISRLLDQLAGQLPETDDGPWRVDLSGDPRGCTVTLMAPEHRAPHERAGRRMTAAWTIDSRPTTEELQALPVLTQGHTDDLHHEEPGRLRFWLSRTTTADGEPYDSTVTIEELRDGSWVTVLQLRRRQRTRSPGPGQ